MTRGGTRPGLTGWLRDLRRAASWHRRLLVAGLLAASVAFGIQALSPTPPRTESVLVVTKNLSGGTRLAPDDVRLTGILLPRCLTARCARPPLPPAAPSVRRCAKAKS